VPRSALILAVLLAACGGGSDDPNNPAPAAPDAGDVVNPEWTSLVEGEWTIAPHTEKYLCVRKTLDRDVYINGFNALSPNGTHHTVVTMGVPNQNDGVTECDSFENHQNMLFGSGVGTNEFRFPEGIGVKVEAGKQILLNLHLFNVSDAEMTGTSGTLIKEISVDQMTEVAEAVLMGPVYLSIPPGEHDQSGTCTVNDSASIFAIAPHMHQLGRHMTVTAKRSTGEDVVFFDEDYDFEEQLIQTLDRPLQIGAGDKIEVSCSYMNHTGKTVGWGESSLDEMCFAGIYKYPASENYFVCTDF
jgi:hypothetical protein